MALGDMLADVDDAIAAEELRLASLMRVERARVHRLARAAASADSSGVRRELEQLAIGSCSTPKRNTLEPDAATATGAAAAAAGAGASGSSSRCNSASIAMPHRLESFADIRIALHQLENTFCSLLSPAATLS